MRVVEASSTGLDGLAGVPASAATSGGASNEAGAHSHVPSGLSDFDPLSATSTSASAAVATPQKAGDASSTLHLAELYSSPAVTVGGHGEGSAASSSGGAAASGAGAAAAAPLEVQPQTDSVEQMLADLAAGK
jgi:hypothetical protein